MTDLAGASPSLDDLDRPLLQTTSGAAAGQERQAGAGLRHEPASRSSRRIVDGQAVAADSPHRRRHLGLLRRPRPLRVRPGAGGEASRRSGLDAAGERRAREGRAGAALTHRHERGRARGWPSRGRLPHRGRRSACRRTSRRTRADDAPARHAHAAASSSSRSTASTAVRTPTPIPPTTRSQAGPGGDNLSGFSDAEADLLLQNARQTSDDAVRLALYRQFQEVFAIAAAQPAAVPAHAHLRHRQGPAGRGTSGAVRFQLSLLQGQRVAHGWRITLRPARSSR